MSDLLTTAAGTLTDSAAGTHVDIAFTPPPGVRNGWNPQPVQVSGTLDAVRVHGHGSVRVVIDGKALYLPGDAPVRVAPHVRVPDAVPNQAVAPASDVPSARTPDDVRAGLVGSRIGVGELSGEHIGRVVEFDHQGVRFFGALTSCKPALGMFSVTLDETEQFLFDEDQSIIVRGMALDEPSTTVPTTRRPAPTNTTPTIAVPSAPASTTAPAGPAHSPTLAAAAAATQVSAPAAWVPVPADELEFV